MVSPSSGRNSEQEKLVIDESFKTRSLPAWVRNKTRPLVALDDLNTIYEKPHWSKRRRNRMRSDAAAVIALSKSQGRLLSPVINPSSVVPSSEQEDATSNSTVSREEEETPRKNSLSNEASALVSDEAVIVYNERTAL
ncbi:hypothetical protein SK128_002489 [Halocaridina rubra]|uniref:Uncharacterized protein n=1 Tax=Halocaridina rubra TaxID=373956 RepID=A0AAN8ZUE6_HALRR